LVLEDGKLKFKTYPNADNPVGEDVAILAAFDVWEHSYYLDYKNDRKEHLTRVINELINYKFIESRLLEA
jgi:Fe-Mn family superoxide dismutase